MKNQATLNVLMRLHDRKPPSIPTIKSSTEMKFYSTSIDSIVELNSFLTSNGLKRLERSDIVTIRQLMIIAQPYKDYSELVIDYIIDMNPEKKQRTLARILGPRVSDLRSLVDSMVLDMVGLVFSNPFERSKPKKKKRSASPKRKL